jgi:trk system potassium uptake protein TrkA
MYVVIAGCGRVGSGLARDLVAEGHEVTVIDENADAFEQLGDDFPGQFVTGQALDWDVLRAAQLERADACVVATDGDNTNLVVAQIAAKAFNVRCAVARIYDPFRAELYAETAGVRTVCPTKDTEMLLHESVRSCQIQTAG